MTYYAYPGTKPTFAQCNMTEKMRLQYGKQIIETVAKYYDVEIEKVYKKVKTDDLVKVRQVSSYLICQRIPNMRLQQVASLFGQRYATVRGYDHTAVIFNKQKISDLISVNDSVKDDIETIKNLI